uniref:Chorion class B protein Ld34 n=1 Tax=Lymantria dispar TaxID=13123 RepID=CHB3_LYMDI|nr:RecName: Full=Chorion class B protein Ld34; Flags: Precursor [Lymantria dispar]AAA67868.1 chorion protein [Lymantria dispar]
MSAKIILVFCAQALFVQSALSQCTSRATVAADRGIIGGYGLGAPYGLAYGLEAPLGLGYGLGAPCGLGGPAIDITPTIGGGLPVSSASAIAPVGLAVASENVYEGILAAAGELPFVGTVGVEGVLPTAGAGAVHHSCGNGINAMASRDAAFAPGYAGAYGIGLGAYGLGVPALEVPALGYRAGWRGCGCGL